MAAKTRLGLHGFGTRRAGSFSGRTPGTHPLGKVVRLGNNGFGTRRVGSFAGKTAELGGSHPVGKITRHGLCGYGTKRVGSFAGRTSVPLVEFSLDEPPKVALQFQLGLTATLAIETGHDIGPAFLAFYVDLGIAGSLGLTYTGGGPFELFCGDLGLQMGLTLSGNPHQVGGGNWEEAPPPATIWVEEDPL